MNIEELDSDDNEFLFEFEIVFRENILPNLVRHLIVDGLLDTNRLSDKNYIASVIRFHSKELIDDLPINVVIEDEFLESARDAIAADRPAVAIVMIATSIEHKLNIFYRNAFIENESNLDNNVITNIIRSNSLSDKTGWLFSFVLHRKMDSDLQKTILELAELRNQIVHYKAIPAKNIDDESSGSHNAILKKLENLNFDEVFKTVERLSDALENELLDLQLSRDDYKYAQEAMKTLLSDS